jgi:hypothetical protein
MGVTWGSGGDESFLGNVGDLIIICLEAAEGGDIFSAAV